VATNLLASTQAQCTKERLGCSKLGH